MSVGKAIVGNGNPGDLKPTNIFGVGLDKDMFPCAYDETQKERTDSCFLSDFLIAERFGMGAVKDTYKRATRDWAESVKYLAELAVVLNKRCWAWYDYAEREKDAKREKEMRNRCAWYSEKYYEVREIVEGEGSTFSDDDKTFFYNVLD